MSARTAAAVPYATAGYEVILDFSIPPWFVDTVRQIADVRKIPLSFVVLRPSDCMYGTGPPLAAKARLRIIRSITTLRELRRRRMPRDK